MQTQGEIFMMLLCLVAAGFMAKLALYDFTYLPMSQNYAECGKITLCNR